MSFALYLQCTKCLYHDLLHGAIIDPESLGCVGVPKVFSVPHNRWQRMTKNIVHLGISEFVPDQEVNGFAKLNYLPTQIPQMFGSRETDDLALCAKQIFRMNKHVVVSAIRCRMLCEVLEGNAKVDVILNYERVAQIVGYDVSIHLQVSQQTSQVSIFVAIQHRTADEIGFADIHGLFFIRVQLFFATDPHTIGEYVVRLSDTPSGQLGGDSLASWRTRQTDDNNFDSFHAIHCVFMFAAHS